jgi:broad specificity phosphatase PhoE
MIRGIISAALEAGIETVVRLKVNNASLSVLEYEEKGEFLRLTLFNDTSHLE